MATHSLIGSGQVLEKLVKEVYGGNISDLVYKQSTALSMIKKDNKLFRGNGIHRVPIKLADPQNASVSFTNARSAASAASSRLTAFSVTRVSEFAVMQIDNELILETEGNDAAYASALKLELESTLNNLGRSLGIALYGDGYSVLGKVGSVASDVITLTEKNDARKFSIGQKLVTATKGGNPAQNPSSAAMTVVAVNIIDGKITVDDDTGVVANQFIFKAADTTNAVATSKNRVTGLAAWLPSTLPTSGDSFFGIDRSVDSRLTGTILSAAGASIEEAIIDAASAVFADGGSPSHLFCSIKTWGRLEKTLGSRAVLVESDLGFRGVQVQGPKGPIEVYPDICCPEDISYLLDLSKWTFGSMGEVPRLLDQDGQGMLMRVSDSNAIEARWGYYGNLFCTHPSHNAVITHA